MKEENGIKLKSEVAVLTERVDNWIEETRTYRKERDKWMGEISLDMKSINDRMINLPCHTRLTICDSKFKLVNNQLNRVWGIFIAIFLYFLYEHFKK